GSHLAQAARAGARDSCSAPAHPGARGHSGGRQPGAGGSAAACPRRGGAPSLRPRACPHAGPPPGPVLRGRLPPGAGRGGLGQDVPRGCDYGERQGLPPRRVEVRAGRPVPVADAGCHLPGRDRCAGRARGSAGGRCSPGGGALASRRTWLMYSHGSCMSILICGGYAYLFLDLLGYAADPPDRPPFAAMTLVCQVPTLFLGFLWVFSCFGPVDASRRDALARAKSLERIPVSLSQIETFAFCPDSSGSFESTCIICMDDFAEGCDIGRLPCSHFFHDGCIREWLGSKDSCPMRCSANRGASAFGRSMYP
ncbi:unnamed protein product, partial [Prorocentrum cordatum]